MRPSLPRLLPRLVALLLLLLLLISALLPSAAATATAASIRRLSTRAAAYQLSMSATPTNPSRLRLVTNKKCPYAQKVRRLVI